MYRQITTLLLLLVGVVSATADEPMNAHVEISAAIQPIDDHQAELLITGKIADGLHIYAQSQPKPFLATKFNVTEASSDSISVGDFVADRKPIKIQHESLGVELHEFEGTVQWRAVIKSSDALSALAVKGTVFAQACEKESCFAPQTYPFRAEFGSPATVASGAVMQNVDPMETPEPTAAGAQFSISNLQVVPSTQSRSIWAILPLAFIAGLLLNLMPCVLPVVGLKLLSFVQQANSDRKQILLMNLAYTAGLLSVMLVLATLAVFAGLGWGEQFSSAGFTVTLSAIVFAFGLSFLGVWEIPLPGFIGAGGQSTKEGYGGAFSKGILSTLLATPCSGPFLGAVLAWAVTQPAYSTYAVFATVGIGMASPYLVVGLFPSTIRFLPKPGNWMVTFKQVMGFIMLATVVYLMSFMPIASVVPTVLLLLGIGLAVWFAARTPVYESATRRLRAWSIAGAMIALTAVVSFGWLHGVMQSRFERAANRLLEKQAAVTIAASSTDAESLIDWTAYTPERLESLIRDGKPVFIDFTADWCLTCKGNEAAAIETEAVAQAIRDSGAVALRADKTEPSPDVDALLRKLGNAAASIPFYAVFSPNDPSNPVLLDGAFVSSEPFVQAIADAKKPTPDLASVSIR